MVFIILTLFSKKKKLKKLISEWKTLFIEGIKEILEKMMRDY